MLPSLRFGVPGPEFARKKADINIIGPKHGYSPQIGTLVSMMAWMRDTVLMSVKGMSQKDLDVLLDPNADTIGSLLRDGPHLSDQHL